MVTNSIDFSQFQMPITQEMQDYYKVRTAKHIYLVHLVCQILLNTQEFSCDFDNQNMLERCKLHDASKYSEEEIIPYIYLTWYKKHGIQYNTYENKIVQQAVYHHFSVNRHHHEFYQNIEDMQIDDIFEMLCDIKAMAIEFGNCPIEYFNKNTSKKVNFNQKQLEFIEKVHKMKEYSIKLEFPNF